MDLSYLRAQYNNDRLKQPLDDHPWSLMKQWFKEAIANDAVMEPNAMSLATSTADGHPSVRLVLAKEIKDTGVVFFTNYQSQKGREIEENPHVAATIWWPEMERQIRLQGIAEKIAPEESTAYFQSRPKGSQIGAITSPQSQPIPNVHLLEQAMKKIESTARDKKSLERPSHWGGYIILPQSVEFWQGQPNRLHDRILFSRKGQEWSTQRLAP